MSTATHAWESSLRTMTSGPVSEPTWDEAVLLEHEVIGGVYHRFLLESPTITSRAQAGQFVMVTVPRELEGRALLPRPMAIHRRRLGEGAFEIVFSVVGRGTRALTAMQPGQSLLVTGPLGRGFEVSSDARRVLLLGRGIGVCGVMGIAEDLCVSGGDVAAVFSAARRPMVIGRSDAEELGFELNAVSDDLGTSDVEYVRALVAGRPFDLVAVCGSARLTQLAHEIGRETGAAVQVSLEAHMACGLGYCHGCAAPLSRSDEGPLVCVDGPVFELS